MLFEDGEVYLNSSEEIAPSIVLDNPIHNAGMPVTIGFLSICLRIYFLEYNTTD